MSFGDEGLREHLHHANRGLLEKRLVVSRGLIRSRPTLLRALPRRIDRGAHPPTYVRNFHHV
jgi:hypothetical protein